MRALWIEDHHLIADALKDHLHVVMPDVSLDLAQDLTSALRLIATFRYQLVLLDWWLRDENGEAALQGLRSGGCQAPVVVVSGDERDAVRQRALALGAVAYVAKSQDPQDLVSAIRNAMNGSTAAQLQTRGAHCGAPVPAELPEVSIETAFPEVTARQADVFRGLVRGLSDKHIARELGISDTTVKTHVRAILQIVGVQRRGQAAYQAIARGAGAS